MARRRVYIYKISVLMKLLTDGIYCTKSKKTNACEKITVLICLNVRNLAKTILKPLSLNKFGYFRRSIHIRKFKM